MPYIAGGLRLLNHLQAVTIKQQAQAHRLPEIQWKGE